MKKLMVLLALTGTASFAHIKPIPHTHIGFLHPEDILILMGAVGAVAVGAFFFVKSLRT